jgi:hypothetical protein
VIERKYHQRQLGEGFIRDSIDDCWEPWMKIADEILDDEELIEPVYEALRRRRPKAPREDVKERQPKSRCECWP